MADTVARPTPSPFPEFRFSDRSREIEEYIAAAPERIPLVIHAYLVEGLSFRMLDDVCLNINERYPGITNRGYKSQSICSYLGLWDDWKGYFRDFPEVQILADLQRIITFEREARYSSRITKLYEYLLAYYQHSEWIDWRTTMPVKERISKDWVNNVVLKGQSPKDYDDRLRLLSRHKDHRLVLDNVIRYFSSNELKEAIKDLYDFRCQVCGDVIYKTGWRPDLSRKAQWDYLSADVHHIHPLSTDGPDISENMICLCPSCHRKFHSGEFRLVIHGNSLTCKDELLDQSHQIRQLHLIDISL